MDPYYSYRDELSVYDGLIFRGERFVIPRALRYQTMKQRHSSHIGINGSLRSARECLFWPGMNTEIKEYISQCEICTQYSGKESKETLMSHEAPDRLWEKIAVDICTTDGKDYLITVHCFSNFWEIDRLRDTKASTCVRKLKSHFERNGIPDIVTSDNGPQFTYSEFALFTRKWGFEHRTRSPGHQQANGQAESAVKTAKNILRKAKESECDPYLAILAVRNTPTEGMDSSPAQRVLGRRTKTQLPTTAELLKPQGLNTDDVKTRIKTRQQRQAHYYDRKARDLPQLEEEDVVRMRPFALNGKRLGKASVSRRLDERSSQLETEDATYRRNRVDLRKIKGANQEEITRHQVNPRNDIPNPQIARHSSLKTLVQLQETHVLQPPISTPHIKKTKLGAPKKAPSQSSLPTKPRPKRAVREPTYLKDYIRK